MSSIASIPTWRFRSAAPWRIGSARNASRPWLRISSSRRMALRMNWSLARIFSGSIVMGVYLAECLVVLLHEPFVVDDEVGVAGDHLFGEVGQRDGIAADETPAGFQDPEL